MSRAKKIKVRAISYNEDDPNKGWWKIGDIIEVNNYIVNWNKANIPYFEKESGIRGIPVSCCEILPLDFKVIKYTMVELREKLGHAFEIQKD